LFNAIGAELNLQGTTAWAAVDLSFDGWEAVTPYVGGAFSACTVTIKFLGRCPKLTVTGVIRAKETLLTACAREKAIECLSRLLRKCRAR
jgi:hypothetical protein